MGSATTQALDDVAAKLSRTEGVDLAVADELFAAARVVGGSSHLSAALADGSVPSGARVRLVIDVFGSSFGGTTLKLLGAAVTQRWSGAGDLVDGIEELAIRATAVADVQADIEGELFAFSRAIAANPELELALGSRLGDAGAKGTLVRALLDGRAAEGTRLIVTSLAVQPGERRIRQVLGRAMRIVSDQRGRAVATVITATPLTRSQANRLSALLSAKYGRDVALNTVVDSSVVGGLRIEIADDVIDASIASRLADLRQRLAG